MIPARIAATLVAAALCGCSGSGPEMNSDLLEPGSWATMLERGLGIAPVAGVSAVTASPDAAGFFADEFHTTLRSALPGTPIAPPDEIYARLEDAGADAHARLRSLRRRLVREQELDPDELAAIGRDLGERFLLVVFMDEGEVDAFARTNLDDYRAFSYSMGTHGYPTGELHGHAIGFLLDLREGKLVWRAEVEYQSQNLASAGNDAQRVIDETRADAVFRLSEALAAAGRRD